MFSLLDGTDLQHSLHNITFKKNISVPFHGIIFTVENANRERSGGLFCPGSFQSGYLHLLSVIVALSLANS